MASPRRFAQVLLGLVAVHPLQAQRADTLPELRVSVTRAALAPGTAGLAVTLLDSAALHRGRALPALDEALALVPGAVVRDRGDPTQDPRLTIRGAGARANFGVRGVRVLVDGVPATLPDGQTPLTAVDLLAVERIEVARGPLAALHGNGSLGVVAIETAARLPAPAAAMLGFQTGSDATTTWHGVLGGGGERLGGLVAASRSTTEGWRAHAAARQVRIRGSLEWRAAPRSTLTLRAQHADDPILLSPGALTLDEYAEDPRQANPNSLRRDAGKQVRQSSLSLGWQHQHDGGLRLETTAWLLGRDLANPIAAPAPAPADPEEGVWIGIDRVVTGARASIATPIAVGASVVAGIDMQRMSDDRVNRRHRAGEVSGAAFLDQQEVITEVGSFAQVGATPAADVTIRGGVRHDRVAFEVTDRLAPEAGGSRTMAAWSLSGALAWQPSRFEGWLGAGSAFESPTTTELANRPEGGTGLNRELEPSRTTSVEAGIRWRGTTLSVEMVGWRAVTSNAITAVAELGGRSFFTNVGRTTTRGAELALVAHPTSGVTVRGSATWMHATFGDDAVAADGMSIADHQLPGVIPFTARLAVTTTTGPLRVELDHGWSSGVWADDANTLRIDGWGIGVTNAHVRWRLRNGLAMLGAIRNALDVEHVAGVVVNGGFGRIVEPGRPRSVMIGGEMMLGEW